MRTKILENKETQSDTGATFPLGAPLVLEEATERLELSDMAIVL